MYFVKCNTVKSFTEFYSIFQIFPYESILQYCSSIGKLTAQTPLHTNAQHADIYICMYIYLKDITDTSLMIYNSILFII